MKVINLPHSTMVLLPSGCEVHNTFLEDKNRIILLEDLHGMQNARPTVEQLIGLSLWI